MSHELENIPALAKQLAGDLREHLSYLHEVGISQIEDQAAGELPLEATQSASVSNNRATIISENSALTRNARVEAKHDPIKPAMLAHASAKQEKQDDSPQTVLQPSIDQPPMTTKRNTPRPPAANPPPPQDTLFGEITPQDDLSLPRPGETLEDVWNDIGECLRCPLAAGRTHVVNTDGNRSARLMFVGEAPGADEDAQGKPFIGRAGQLLNKMIEAIGMKREEVVIGNVNRCRPPQNRTPTLAEAKTCKPFLLREIAIIKPELIVVLGNTAMKNLLDTKEGITKVRGQFQDYKGIKVLPTFHPAYLLRDPSKKREAWEDLKKARDYLQGKPV